MMDKAKSKIVEQVDQLAEDLYTVSDYLLDNPEIRYEEVNSCRYLKAFLEERGFAVESGAGGLATAFVARPAGAEPKRPTVAFLAEYDALPKIGHGCGHNMIAAAALGAGVALSRIWSHTGQVAVVGTPAEEGGGGKIFMAQAGVFEEMDAALMFHPSQQNLPARPLLARKKFKVEFKGQTAHAASSPEQGVNALDAMINFFNAINTLRQQVRPEARIHGIITHGGDAPNVIPDYTAGIFYVRALTSSYRDKLFLKVEDCVAGAAQAAGCTYHIEPEPPHLDGLRRLTTFETAMQTNMELLGIPVHEYNGRCDSSDLANLSHVLPSLHPFLEISQAAGHTVEFARDTASPDGRKALLNAAKMLALTGYDFLNNQELRERVGQEFRLAEAQS